MPNITRIPIASRAGSVLTGLLLAACFNSTSREKTPAELITQKPWRIQSVAYDLGKSGNGGWNFGHGKPMVLGGDSMLVLSDSQSPDTGMIGSLFTMGRNCYYGVQWENPGVCLQDDLWTFSMDSTLSVVAGTDLCDSTQAPLSIGKWFLKAGGAEIGIRIAGDSTVFHIENLSGTQLSLSETELDTAGICGKSVQIKTLYSFTAR